MRTPPRRPPAAAPPAGAAAGRHPQPQDPEEELAMFRRIFDAIPSGAMVTDARGMVTHLNQPYADFLGLECSAQIGRHCTAVVENTRMHLVARSGRAELYQTQMIRGQEIVVHRIPIRRDGRVVAVLGLVMFQDVREVARLARRLSFLERKVRFYEAELKALRSTRYTLESIVGCSPAMEDLRREARRAAQNRLPVLITGESGTGKELFAQAIHHASARRLQPFVRINCAAIPRDLLEAELFGYEQGAFTGARAEGKPGKFELADGGTVFLDEIGDLPLEMQPKLLRVLEEREFERVGGTGVRHSDFRLIAATNQDLQPLMTAGRFRPDLFYRLSVIPLHIPPLRERRDDILPLVHHMLQRMGGAGGRGGIRLAADAQGALQTYPWPGNHREVQNLVERVLCALEGDTLRAADLPAAFTAGLPTGAGGAAPLRHAQADAERQAIRSALDRCGHNKAAAARALGIHRTLLYKKMHRLGIGLRGARCA